MLKNASFWCKFGGEWDPPGDVTFAALNHYKLRSAPQSCRRTEAVCGISGRVRKFNSFNFTPSSPACFLTYIITWQIFSTDKSCERHRSERLDGRESFPPWQAYDLESLRCIQPPQTLLFSTLTTFNFDKILPHNRSVSKLCSLSPSNPQVVWRRLSLTLISAGINLTQLLQILSH